MLRRRNKHIQEQFQLDDIGWARSLKEAEERPRLSREQENQLFAGAEEASRFFMGNSDVQHALEKIARLLDEDGIPYAIVGAMALNAYGYRRQTVDVDILLTPAGLDEFKAKHLGLGYLPKFPGSKSLRDTENGVSIDVLLTGEYPGDGRPKPVVFPDPAEAAVKGERVALLPLPTLIELKLASGISAPHRLKDLADVLELVRILDLPEETAEDLHSYVREKYREIWRAAQEAERE